MEELDCFNVLYFSSWLNIAPIPLVINFVYNLQSHITFTHISGISNDISIHEVFHCFEMTPKTSEVSNANTYPDDLHAVIKMRRVLAYWPYNSKIKQESAKL